MTISQHDRVRACPQCGGRDLRPLVGSFFAQTSRKSDREVSEACGKADRDPVREHVQEMELWVPYYRFVEEARR